MQVRTTIRASLAALVMLATAGCAQRGGMTQQELARWGPVEGPMCKVRVESSYDEPVEAGARAGARDVALGVVDPRGRREFGVPCAHRAVTVYRLIRPGALGETRLGAHTRALDPEDVTVVTLRSSSASTR